MDSGGQGSVGKVISIDGWGESEVSQDLVFGEVGGEGGGGLRGSEGAYSLRKFLMYVCLSQILVRRLCDYNCTDNGVNILQPPPFVRHAYIVYCFPPCRGVWLRSSGGMPMSTMTTACLTRERYVHLAVHVFTLGNWAIGICRWI